MVGLYVQKSYLNEDTFFFYNLLITDKAKYTVKRSQKERLHLFMFKICLWGHRYL